MASSWRSSVLTSISPERLEDRPMEVYRYLDGRVLYDPEDRLAVLADNARKRFEDYRTTEREKEHLAYWLRRARTKAIASREAGDSLRAAFVVSTSSWQIWKPSGPPTTRRCPRVARCSPTRATSAGHRQTSSTGSANCSWGTPQEGSMPRSGSWTVRWSY